MESVTPSEPLLLLALVLTGVAFVLTLVVGAATRPRSPKAGPATMDLGPEPPATVDLLTDDFEVTQEAVTATVLDLAARRWLSVDEPAPGTVLVRLRARDGRGELKAFEAQVMGLVHELAVDGVVRAEALTTGREGMAEGWFKVFRKAVVADAQTLGLCRRRWPGWVPSIMTLLTLGAGACVYFSIEVPDDESLRFTPLLVAAVAATAAMFAISGKLGTSDRQRDTPAGREAAARWLGVRRYLADHGDFERQPAAAVTVWDRYLGHAAALDLATTAVEQIPLGAESDRHAWTASDGRWRHVRVSYPRLRPGWGRHPVVAVLVGLLGIGVCLALMRAGVWLHDEATGLGDAVDPTATGSGDSVEVWAGRIGLVLAAVAAVPLLYFLLQLGLGASDLFSSRTMEGEVLRTRERARGLLLRAPNVFTGWTQKSAEPRWMVAVDPGGVEEVAAWRVRRELYPQLAQRQRMRAEVTPRVGYVRSIEVIGHVSAPTPAEITAPTDLRALLGVNADDPLGQALLQAARALGGSTTAPDERGPTPF